MKTKLSIVIVALTLSVGGVSWADLADWLYGESWTFMQSVGGIAVGTPTRNAQRAVVLPVHCDVSGLQAITTEPTQLNSALTVKKIEAKADGTTISLSVFSGLTVKGETSSCSETDLGNLPAGRYDVVYFGSDHEPHALGSIDIPSKQEQ